MTNSNHSCILGVWSSAYILTILLFLHPERILQNLAEFPKILIVAWCDAGKLSDKPSALISCSHLVVDCLPAHTMGLYSSIGFVTPFLGCVLCRALDVYRSLSASSASADLTHTLSSSFYWTNELPKYFWMSSQCPSTTLCSLSTFSKWLAYSSPKNFTPQVSTIRVTIMGCNLWGQKQGV